MMKTACLLKVFGITLVAAWTWPVGAMDPAPSMVEVSGVVAETMEGGRYTYMRLTSEDETIWVAASHVDVAVGDPVTARGATIMEQFESPTLERTFERILFADEVIASGEPSRRAMPSLPAGHPVSPHGGRSDAAFHRTAGTVVETMDSGNYTYVLIDTGDGRLWAVTDRFNVQAGDRVLVPGGMMAERFESPSLGRTFDRLLFANAIEVVTGDAADGEPVETPSEFVPVAPVSETLAPPEGGMSIGDLHRRRAELAGQSVVVRGRVTKFTERVLGRNWLHIADGTSDGAAADLTISTEARARVGDVVTATGTVAIDEDLGYGYHYDVLLKDATLAPE